MEAHAALSAQFADNFRGRLAYSNSDRTEKGLLPSVLGNDPTTANYDVNNKYPNYTVGLNLDYVASPNVFFGLRGGYYSQDQHTTGAVTDPRTIFNTSNIGLLDVPVALQRGAGLSSFPAAAFNGTDFDLQTRLTTQLDGTVYFRGWGDHAVKAGVQYDRLRNNVQSGELGNRVTYRWNQALSGVPDAWNGIAIYT